MFVIIGQKDHGYDGYGSPIFCSSEYDSAQAAEDNIQHLPTHFKGYEIIYQVLEIDGEFLDQW
jgi:hypothetical protein